MLSYTSIVSHCFPARHWGSWLKSTRCTTSLISALAYIKNLLHLLVFAVQCSSSTTETIHDSWWVHSFFKYIPPLVHLLVTLGLTKAKVINAIFGGQKSDFLLRLGCYKTLNTFLNILIFSFNISSGTQNMRWFWNQSIAHEAKRWMKISHLDQTWVPASKYFFSGLWWK